MASVEAFERMLKDVVQSKRLSASKMNSLTEIAMKSMEHDTQLVSILYRTHKSLQPSLKVSSLYVFDALSRAARHHVYKHGITGDVHSTTGNFLTFLLKVEGVLEGLFYDMILIGTSESKEKTRKILDIWVKGNTFPSHILSRLSDMLEGKEQGSEMKPLIIRPNIGRQTTPSTPTTTISAVSMVPPKDQAKLLALLTQVAHSSSVPVPSQTDLNVGQGTGLDAAQRAVLQKFVAQTANNATHSQPTQAVSKQGDTVHFVASPSRDSPNETHSERRPNGLRSPEGVNMYDDHFSARPFSRGGSRGAPRGRWRVERRRWDDRDRDCYKGRERNERSPVRRHQRSRSGSPNRSWGRHDVRPYSPPRWSIGSRRRDSISAPRDPDKDEFGRDIRPQSPESDTTTTSKTCKSPSRPSHAPTTAHSHAFIADTASAPSQTAPLNVVADENSSSLTGQSNHHQMSLKNSVAANTSPKPHSAFMSSSTAQPGMENFNPATFDFTNPSSWEALGKMWQVTHGELPSTDNLMQFVVAAQAQVSIMNTLDWAGQPAQQWDSPDKGEYGNEIGPEGYYENGNDQMRNGLTYEYDNNNQDTNMMVSGSGISQNPVHTADKKQGSPDRGAGGRMQKVGDKWVFVRSQQRLDSPEV